MKFQIKRAGSLHEGKVGDTMPHSFEGDHHGAHCAGLFEQPSLPKTSFFPCRKRGTNLARMNTSFISCHGTHSYLLMAIPRKCVFIKATETGL